MNNTLKGLCVLTLLLAACGEKNAVSGENEPETRDQVNRFSRFLGRWEAISEEGELSEIWSKENDSCLTGASYFSIGGDTVFSEQVRLERSGNKWQYIVSIPEQNDGKPVAFTATKLTDGLYVFENPAHDYPQKITYTFRNDSLIASISGMINGKQKEEFFPMKKSVK